MGQSQQTRAHALSSRTPYHNKCYRHCFGCAYIYTKYSIYFHFVCSYECDKIRTCYLVRSFSKINLGTARDYCGMLHGIWCSKRSVSPAGAVLDLFWLTRIPYYLLVSYRHRPIDREGRRSQGRTGKHKKARALSCCAFVFRRGCTGETTITIPDCCAPPILAWSLVVTPLVSRVCDVWVPSVLCFLLWSTKKKEALHCCCCRVLKGWFKVIAPDSYRVRSMSTPFIWEIPYFLHVFTVPLPNRSRLKKRKLRSFQRTENKKNRKSWRAGRGTLNTCAKYQGLIFQKWRVHLDFCAVSMQIWRFAT